MDCRGFALRRQPFPPAICMPKRLSDYVLAAWTYSRSIRPTFFSFLYREQNKNFLRLRDLPSLPEAEVS